MTEDNVLSGPPGLNLPDISLGQYILNKLRENPLHIIQVDARTGKVLTNHELLDKSVKLAIALEKRGINPGDTVAICSENNFQWFIAACAIMFRGACVSPMNPAYLEDEINHCLNISKPRIIFVSRRTENMMNRVIKKLQWNIELIQFDDASELNEIVTLKNIIEALKELPDPFSYQAQILTRPFEKEVVILCSSGTTGMPKGVMLSNRNMLAVLHALHRQEVTKLKSNSVILFVLPFFHGYGFAMMLSTIAVNNTVVFMESFDPELFCQSIQKYQVNFLPLVPPIMVFLAKHPMISNYNFSSVTDILCGAAPLSPEIKLMVQKRFGNKMVIRNSYGMTELSVCSTMSPRDTIKKETIGQLTPGTWCKVIDPITSKSLKANEPGELCFKGDHVMLGYKGDSKATSQTIDESGWLHSGDLGYYDNDGFLFIIGRLKELIKYKGFQISPAEIESYLLKHPDVIDAAVIGKYDEMCGEIPMAFVVRRPGSKITSDELCAYINERVSIQKRLRGGVKFIGAIPKNPAGKILRRELQKLVSKL